MIFYIFQLIFLLDVYFFWSTYFIYLEIFSCYLSLKYSLDNIIFDLYLIMRARWSLLISLLSKII